MARFLVLFLVVVSWSSLAVGQVACPRCVVPSGSCRVVLGSSADLGPVSFPVSVDWFSMIAGGTESERVALVNFAGAACRIRRGNVCGTGSFCGRDSSGDFVLTNAHVAGTLVGGQVSVELRVGGGVIRSVVGRVVMAAYSSRTRTDWAVVRCPVDSFVVNPRPLSKGSPPNAASIGFWGCPGCAVPSGVVLSELQDSGNTASWLPNSIGGQSGSSLLRLDTGACVVLLTWTSGGRGLGQTTAGIFRQAAERNTDGQARDGSEIVRSNVDDLQEGFHAESGILDLPIWESDGGPGPGGDPDCEKLVRLRALFLERGSGTRWAEVIRLVFLLIEELLRSSEDAKP